MTDLDSFSHVVPGLSPTTASNPDTQPSRISRRTALRAGIAGAAALAASTRISHVRAQDGDQEDNPFDSGGRIPIEYDETASFNEIYNHPPLLGRAETWRV